MCGIAGAIGRVYAGERAASLDAMHRAITHRGPDDRGAWQSPQCQAAFVHTRLSIIDPSPAGRQPMTVADGRFTIVYNGEIYNFAELRASLTKTGVPFHSTSDTEVILRLYEAEGPPFVERLRGMFAFAIWDEQERSCFIARDRFGIKPLYYHESRGVLMFASEVRALLAAGVAPAIDATAACQYFHSGSVPEPLTLIQGIRALEAGHCLLWRDGRSTIRRYWELSFPEPESVSDPAATARDALIDSVRHHFVSDVPVGVFLSGGIDSTAIVAIARLLGDGELRTFSLAFPGSPLDEGPAARRTANHFKTNHQEWAVDGASARHLLDEFIAAADQPSIDGFNTFTVCRLARRYDAKVVLSGLGGDELFGGYPSFREVPRLVRLAKVARLGGRFGAGAVRAATRLGPSRVRRLSDLMYGPASPGNAYAVFRGIFTRDEARMLTRHYLGSDVSNDAESDGLASDPTVEDSVSRLEMTRYMRNQLLRDADIMSMASGVEVRVPFIDQVLFDRLSRLAARHRLQTRKALLRRAVPEIPEWVANNLKRGFVLPIQRWLEHDWSGTIAAPTPPPSVALDTWYRQWSVLTFEHWLRRVAPRHG